MMGDGALKTQKMETENVETEKAERSEVDARREALLEVAPHPLQRLLDSPWVLLALGLLVPALSYTMWGWIELTQVAPATLP
jgi:hypothetical protein